MRLAILAVFLTLAAGSAAALDDLSMAVVRQAFPQETVSVGERIETPPSAAVRAGDGRLLGYVFSTREVSGSIGYSGRPLDVVAIVTPQGIIAGARIVAHEEPILVIGIPREAVAAYVTNFRGFDVLAGTAIRTTAGAGKGPQAIAGASVTSAVIRDALIRSARTVLRSRADSAATPDRPRLDRETQRLLSWPDLVSEGAVRRLQVSRGEAARRLGIRDAEPNQMYIDLWLGLITPPAIGENLIGQRDYESLIASLAPDDNLLLIAANGLYSFRGTEWRRSGVFDRIEIIQGDRSIRLRAQDHRLVERLRIKDAPEFREIAIFQIAKATGFDPTAPFRLDLDLGHGHGRSAIVSLDYRIPDAFLITSARADPSQSEPRAAPVALDLAHEPVRAPLWQDIWWQRRLEIAGLLLMLGTLGIILIFQDVVTARGNLYRRLRVGYLAMTVLFLGMVANAQLSVVNVITFIHALLSGFRWELFLLDPLVFLLWSFVAVSMLFWGRGVFCGWLCPFGALQELLYKLTQALGMKRFEIPFAVHERLWMIKYVIFLGILAISLNSIMAAFGLAEIEPFKTAITMKFMRDWPFITYALALLAAGLLIERFFCRYLCPLGAALAIPARIRMFEWLKRYRTCGAECQVCARRCTVQAVHPLGQINPNECIYCLQCQSNYFDREVCLHIKKREERRRPRETASTPTKGAARVS
ncbi:MAG: regulatory protein NosR [Hyphomicrobiales bacterium]|nr:regulatory protein NosR [Hyphomicrobiales bacterium]